MKKLLLAAVSLTVLNLPADAKTPLDLKFDKCAEDINDGDPVAGVDPDGTLEKKVLESINACTEWLEDPKSDEDDRATVLKNRALGYTQIGKFTLALRDAEEAIRLDPKSASSYRRRGNIYKAMGEKELYEADKKKVDELRNAAKKPAAKLEEKKPKWAAIAIAMNKQWISGHGSHGAFSTEEEARDASLSRCKAFSRIPDYCKVVASYNGCAWFAIGNSRNKGFSYSTAETRADAVKNCSYGGKYDCSGPKQICASDAKED
jgi:tetratricopeptide (TPR) repeat protein